MALLCIYGGECTGCMWCQDTDRLKSDEFDIFIDYEEEYEDE